MDSFSMLKSRFWVARFTLLLLPPLPASLQADPASRFGKQTRLGRLHCVRLPFAVVLVGDSQMGRDEMRRIQKWESDEVERRRKRALAEELSQRMCSLQTKVI